jgi:hypothetical protein
MLKRARHFGKRIAQALGTLQARLLLVIVYALLVLPFGICVRLLADPLRMKRRPSQWLEPPTETHDLPWARRQ